MVKWPVHPEIWERIKDFSFDYNEDTFAALNKIMRGFGFTETMRQRFVEKANV